MSPSGSLQRIIDGLASSLSRAVSIDDEHFRLQLYSRQSGPVDDVRIMSILQRDSPEAAKQWVRDQGVRRSHRPIRLPAAPSLGLLPRVCVPIRNADTFLGYLWIIDADGTMTDDGLRLAASSAEEVAPHLYRLRRLDLLDRRSERAALSDLISPRAETRDDASALLQTDGVLSGSMEPVVLVCEMATNAAPERLSVREAVALDAALARSRTLVEDRSLGFFREGTRTILVLAADDRAVDRTSALAFGRRLQAMLAGALPGRRVVVGIGMRRAALRDARDSFLEALDVARVLVRVPGIGDVAQYGQLGVYRLLARVPEPELQASLISEELRRLMALGHRSGELLETLEVFLDRAGDVGATAAELGLHRSSVYNRLRRIEDLTGSDLTDGRMRLDLHFGLAVARFTGVWPPG